MKPLMLILLALTLWQSAPAMPRSQDDFHTEVRVLLTRWRSAPFHVSCTTRWRAESRDSKRDFAAGEQVTVQRDGDQIVLKTAQATHRARDWSLQGDAPLTISDNAGNNGRSYRGRIVLRIHQDRVQVLNVLTLEDYLQGVVPLEMPPGFPAEALKAQAIAARSWAVRNRAKHEAEGADFCDGTHCQVYGGVDAERDSTTSAVQSTAGLVVARDNMPVDGTYTADCGGQPAVPDNAPPPPPDSAPNGKDYCSANPRHQWSLGFTFLEVWQAVAGQDSTQDTPNGDIDVQIVQSDAGGRVQSLRIRWGAVTREITGARLRTQLKLPSTLFSVRLDQGNTIVFEGRGSGHGYGLCQWGAAGRARAGQTAEQILQAYYPGAGIVPLSEVIWEWRKSRNSGSAR